MSWRLMLALACATAHGAPSGIPRFAMEPGPLELSGAVNPWRFIKSVGLNAGVWGTESGRLEGWIYPVKVFRDFHLVFETGDGKKSYAGEEIARSVRVFPHMVQLTYAAQEFSVVETIFTPRRQPGFVILLEVRTRAPLRVMARFTPDLNLMWPVSLHGQTAVWEGGENRVRLEEGGGRYSALVGSPAAAGAWVEARAAQIDLRIDPGQASRVYLPIVAAGGVRGVFQAEKVYDDLLRNVPELMESARRYYVDVDRNGTVFETPDPAVNEALRWSRISLEQLRVCNPNMEGCGFVAGYRASGAAYRPGFAWFYKEPTIAARAFLGYGGAASLRDAFRFLRQFQREDGKAIHEVPQSAEGREWLKTFGWAYTHTNTSLFYIAAVADYFRFTADRAFLEEIWPSVRKAYDYTVSLLDPADGLIVIPEGDWGSTERRNDIAKDANLAGQWIATLRAMRDLSEGMHDERLAAECSRHERRAAESLERKFWNPAEGYYDYGVDRAGQVVRLLRPEIGFSAWWGSLPEERARAVLRRLSTSAFLADWGQRIVSLDDPEYSEGVYEGGSVWPFRSAGALLGHYRHHNSVQAFSIWMAMMRLRLLHGRGSMPEVLSGHSYRLLDGGVPHQMFSELAVIPGLVEGIAGLQPDMPRGVVHLTPHVPPTWPAVAIGRLPLGGGLMDLRLRQSPGRLAVEVSLSGDKPVTLDFAPALPAGSEIDAVVCDGRPAAFELEAQQSDVHVRTRTTLGARRSTIEVRYRPGVAVEPEWRPVLDGDPSTNLRVVETRFQDRRLEVDVEGRPDVLYRLRLHTPWTSARTEGVQTIRQAGGMLIAETGAPAAGKPDRAGYVKWTVRVWFAGRTTAPGSDRAGTSRRMPGPR